MIQPDEGISLAFNAKEPGPEINLKAVHMHFSYSESFRSQPAEAYERLLHDAMEGDHTLFIREDEVERSWEIVEGLLEDQRRAIGYAAGTWGPSDCDDLISPRRWHLH